MNERFLKISKNNIYFTNNDFIELRQTNFPENSLSFKYHLDIYLKVEISNFNKQLKSLDVKIIDYKPTDFHDFNNQKSKKKIEKIAFKELEWSKLEKLLSSYKNNLPEKIPEAFEKGLNNYSEKTEPSHYLESIDFSEPKTIGVNLIKLKEVKPLLTPIEDKIQIIDFEFYECFKNSTFHLGYVSFKKKFDNLISTIEIKIYNENILPEYDYIKKYFSNHFDNGIFNISTKIEIKNQEILSVSSSSKEIEAINNQIIDSIKEQRILKTIDLIDDIENEKNTFTADEILSKVDNSINIFKETEEDLINLILELKSPRNKKQLIYLASKKHNQIEKIRFTLKPLFRFIFFIEGKENNHICWELLNSHATYLWTFKKTIPISLIIEESEININTIKQIGRQKYRKQVKKNELETNAKFSVINHSKSKQKEEFNLWKNKLESKLK
ncbi:hypothetical protein [Tenacibaculum salmonis]|uniref:hypothetical protein n=1 Tax=Tenacibaculum sp. P3-BQ1 TaxID=3232310 RepID=UPI0034DEE442